MLPILLPTQCVCSLSLTPLLLWLLLRTYRRSTPIRRTPITTTSSGEHTGSGVRLFLFPLKTVTGRWRSAGEESYPDYKAAADTADAPDAADAPESYSPVADDSPAPQEEASRSDNADEPPVRFPLLAARASSAGWRSLLAISLP